MYKSYKFRKGKSENISLRVYIDSKDKYSMFIYNTVWNKNLYTYVHKYKRDTVVVLFKSHLGFMSNGNKA